MRHKARRLRLNQKPDHARLLKRNLVTSVILYESIRTTRKRARVIQPLIDKLITLSKSQNVSVAIRAINTQVADKNASRKLMQVLNKRYADRTSGFTRMKAVGARKGDGAELVDLTLIDAEIASKAPKAAAKSEKKQTTPKKAAAKKTATTESSESSASSK
jgi:large subunit ribosomal protein L17